jgi:hypothetical protein
VANELEEQMKVFTATEGYAIVLDTNVVLRTKLITTLDWSALVNGGQARVILPLRVVEELDAKKYGSNEEFRKVVRRLLPKIDALLDGAEGSYAKVTPSLTIEILVAPGPRHNLSTLMKRSWTSLFSCKPLPGAPSPWLPWTRPCVRGPGQEASTQFGHHRRS